MSFSVEPKYREIKFAVAPYKEVEPGKLSPARPSSCPYRQFSFEVCKIEVKSSRDRKTGPMHPLHIYRCATHGHCFTIYPLGFTPFSRQLIFLPYQWYNSLNDLKHTYFDAAIDGNKLVKWPEDSDPFSRPEDFDFKGIFKTQKRHINGVCRLLGVDPTLEGQVK